MLTYECGLTAGQFPKFEEDVYRLNEENFRFMLPTAENIFGLLSLVTWTLLVIITFQYIWLAMSLSDKGEGGTIVLQRILDTLRRQRKAEARDFNGQRKRAQRFDPFALVGAHHHRRP